MNSGPMNDSWAAGDAYEAFMGQWSRPMAGQFIRWLGAEPGLAWLDVGCGTGALTSAICGLANPSSAGPDQPRPISRPSVRKGGVN